MEAKDIISSGILELYATGITTVAESIEVENCVATFPEVAIELDKIIASLEAYAMSMAIEPNASVKEKIFGNINFGNDTNGISADLPTLSNFNEAKVVNINRGNWRFVAAASLILLIGSIAFNILLFNKNNNSTQRLLQSQQELASIKADNNALNKDWQVIQNKFSKPVSLQGLEAAPNAAAKVFWIQNTGELYIDPSNLPEAPAGKQYQLWGIVDGKPVSAGMITTAKSGDKYRILKMKSFGKAEAFAVTLENEPNNTAPKGPMFVMGKL